MGMSDEIELISDGDGLAIIGEPGAVERFIGSLSLAKEVEPRQLNEALSVGAAGAQLGSTIAENSGRWLKLTKESADAIKDVGLIPTKTPGVSFATMGKPGKIAEWVKVVSRPSSILTNPAALAGAAGIMSQMAMKQQLDEITEYLKIIDAKLDGVIRSQTNQVLAKLDGVSLAIREAKAVRESVGRVSEITWSKVQASVQTIYETQGYAIRQIKDVGDNLESPSKIADLMKVAEDAVGEVQKWLIVLARCFELLDEIGILELDRVLDASPEELDQHRIGLKSARKDHLQFVLEGTDYLLDRMKTAVEKANTKVLFNPMQSPTVIKAGNQVFAGVHELRELLGIESGAESSEARRWGDAASESWGQVREQSSDGLDKAKELGSSAADKALSVKASLSGKFANRKNRNGEGDSQHHQDS
jgi:hypothetical protein